MSAASLFCAKAAGGSRTRGRQRGKASPSHACHGGSPCARMPWKRCTALLRAPQRRRQEKPRERHRHRAQRDGADLESDRLQAVEDPAVERVGAPIDHDVDHVLRLVFLLAPDDREEHLPRRIGDGEVHPPLGHLEHEHHRQARRPRQREEADDIDRRQRRRRHAGAEALEEPAGGEDLRGQRQKPHDQVDARKDPRLRAGALHGRRHHVRLHEIKDRRAERQQADPRADAEQVRRAEQPRQRGEGAAARRATLVAPLRPGCDARTALQPIARRTPRSPGTRWPRSAGCAAPAAPTARW